MFQKEIERYERVRAQYEQRIVKKMSSKDYLDWHEVLFSCHSCAIEGNSFTLDDTRVLQEKGLAMVPVGRSLLECTEIADHFRAFRYITSNLNAPFDEALLKETNRLVTENTLAYRVPEAVAGEYTTCDMAAGDTIFGDHEKLIARVPGLMKSTAEALTRDIHPLIVAARFHGFFEYLHPFRDGNGRTGRLLSNWIMLHCGHPLIIIDIKDRAAYIDALRKIRSEGTDEYLISLFFAAATTRMENEMAQKNKNTHLGTFLF
ncbi:MAG: Fic family protein [Muribaculaceae bacterium]|nr:Fic family protein [Muribaculaceae bacterium]